MALLADLLTGAGLPIVDQGFAVELDRSGGRQ